MEENEKKVEEYAKGPLEEQPIKETTVEGLIDRLIELKYIKSGNEEITLRDSLRQTVKQFEDATQISQFMLALSDEIKESPKDIFTPTGINLAGLKKVLENVKNEVEIKIQPESRVQDTDDRAVLIEDKERVARIEEIKEMATNYYGKLNDVFNFMGVSDLEYDDDELIELSQDMAKRDMYYKLKGEGLNAGKTLEEAEELARQGAGIEEGELDAPEMKEAAGLIFGTTYKELEEQGYTKGEILEIIKQSKPGIVQDCFSEEDIEKIEKGENPIEILAKNLKDLRLQSLKRKVDRQNNKIQEIEEAISIYQRDGANINIETLITAVEEKEEADRKKAKKEKILKKLLGRKEKKGFEDILEEIAQKYASTDELSLSDIFEELKNDRRAEGLEFDTVLEYVKNDAYEHLQDSGRSNNLMILENSEKELRKISQILEAYYISIEGAQESKYEAVRKANRAKVRDLEEKAERLKANTAKIKEELRKSKEIEKTEYTEEEKKERISRKQTKLQRKSIISSEKAINDKNRISRDRNEIIKLAKSEGISINEAAQRYFEENPGRLQKYTAEEQGILLDEQTNSKREEANSITDSTKVNGLKSAIEGYEIFIEVACTHDTKDFRLSETLIKKEQKENELHKIQRAAEKETILRNNDVQGLMKQKEREAVLKMAFVKYFETGMSVSEVLESMNENGLTDGIKKYELLEEINNRGTMYLSQGYIMKMVENEKEIIDLELEIKALQMLKENAVTLGDSGKALAESHDKKIESIRKRIDEIKQSMAQKREKVAEKLGVKSRDESHQQEGTTGKEQENASESKTISATNPQSSKKSEPSQVSSGIKVESIKVADETQDKQMVDAAKVAKKGKIKGIDLKAALSWIKNLKSLKEKKAEQKSELPAGDKNSTNVQEVEDEEISQ